VSQDGVANSGSLVEHDATKNDFALVANDSSSITSPMPFMISASRHTITPRTTGEQHHASNLYLSPNSAFLLPSNYPPATPAKSTVTPSRFSWQTLTNLVPPWAPLANKSLMRSPSRTAKFGKVLATTGDQASSHSMQTSPQ